jgi:hypothetical protein
MKGDKGDFEIGRTVVALAVGLAMNGIAEERQTAKQLLRPRGLQRQQGQGDLCSMPAATLSFSSHGEW